MVRREAIARSHLALNDSGQVFDLRMAVWHHSIEGEPYRTDYMDADIVRGMIGRDFRLGLYGHQHRAQAAAHQVWLANQEKMAAVSAGSLCAGAKELPVGTYRQYGILEIAEDFKSVRVNVRAMSVANLFSPARLSDYGGNSFVDLDWTPPRNIAGVVIDVDAVRVRHAIEKAERAAKNGDAHQAVTLLRHLALPAGSYQRELLLDSARQCADWRTIVEVTEPPLTSAELVLRTDALGRLDGATAALNALDRYAEQLQLSDDIATDMRYRIKAQKAMRQ